MNVWIVKVGESIPFEKEPVRLLRAGILAKTLVEKGHQVTWWISSVDHASKTLYPQASQEELDLPWGAKLVFLKSVLYLKNLSLKRFINHWGIARQFRKKSYLYQRPDIVFCCLPTIELSYVVVNFCKKEGIPVLIDIRDLHPDVFINLFPSSFRWIGKIFFYPLTWMTQKALSKATGLTAISNTYLKWGLNLAKRKSNNFDGVYPISYPLVTKAPPPEKDFLEKMAPLKSKKNILFIGSFVSSIDLETVIQTARLFQDQGKSDFHFILAGDGDYRALWENMAQDLQNVTFTGWVNRDQIAWLAQQAWAGVCAYKKDALMSLPNKIFEYMRFGLPMFSSLKGETREFLEETGCGVYYEAGNSKSLQESINKLSPKKREEMSRLCIQNYTEKYAAPIVYGDLINHLDRIVREKTLFHLAKRTSFSRMSRVP